MNKFWNKESVSIMWLLISCCLLGTAVGAVFANVAYPYRGSEAQVLGIYVIEQLKNRNISSRDYLYYLLEQRFSAFFLFVLVGITGAARPAAVCAMGCMGFMAGAVGSMTVLQYGIKGLGIFLAANFPQVLVFAPTVIYLMTGVYRINGKIWKKPRKAVKEYMILVLISGLTCFLGVILECYGNPVFLSRLFSLS